MAENIENKNSAEGDASGYSDLEKMPSFEDKKLHESRLKRVEYVIDGTYKPTEEDLREWEEDTDFIESQEFMEAFIRDIKTPTKTPEVPEPRAIDPEVLKKIEMNANDYLDRAGERMDDILDSAEKFINGEYDSALLELKSLFATVFNLEYLPDLLVDEEMPGSGRTFHTSFDEESNSITYYHGKESVTEAVGAIAGEVWRAKQYDDSQDSPTNSEYGPDYVASTMSRMFRDEYFRRNPDKVEDLAKQYRQYMRRAKMGERMDRSSVDGFNVMDGLAAKQLLARKKGGSKVTRLFGGFGRRKSA